MGLNRRSGRQTSGPLATLWAVKPSPEVRTFVAWTRVADPRRRSAKSSEAKPPEEGVVHDDVLAVRRDALPGE